LSPLPLFPAFNQGLASLLLEADDTIDLGFGDQVSDFVIAEAALGTLEAELGHSKSS
jgi:hypothetical protein